MHEPAQLTDLSARSGRSSDADERLEQLYADNLAAQLHSDSGRDATFERGGDKVALPDRTRSAQNEESRTIDPASRLRVWEGLSRKSYPGVACPDR